MEPDGCLMILFRAIPTLFCLQRNGNVVTWERLGNYLPGTYAADSKHPADANDARPSMDEASDVLMMEYADMFMIVLM